MRRPILLLLCLLAVAAGGRAGADPARSPFEGDQRLDRPLTLQWKKATLYDAMRQVSRLTGVRLTVGRMLVDEPVTAAVRDLPARTLLTQIAKLTGYTWVRDGGTREKPNYLLFQDRAAALEEENEISGGRLRVVAELQREIDRYRALARMSPEQLSAEVERSEKELEQLFSGGLSNLQNLGSDRSAMRRLMGGMAAHAVATPTGKAMVEVLDSLPPAAWARLIEEEPVVISDRPGPGELPMPPELHNRLRTATPRLPFPRALFRAIGEDAVRGINTLEEQLQQSWNRTTAFRVTVEMSLTTGAQPVGILRATPEPVEPGDTPAVFFAISGLTITSAPSLFEEPAEDPAARERRLNADPVLGRKARVSLPKPTEQIPAIPPLIGTWRSADLIVAAEETWRVPILGDAYNRVALAGGRPPEGEVPFWRMLDAIGGLTRDWSWDGEVVRFRSRTWAYDRRSEIPARYMARWLEVREKQGGFTLDNLAEIAAMLSDAQVEGLLFSALEAGSRDFTDFVMVSMNRDILRFYGRLIPPQRKALAAGRRLPVRELFPYQQRALLALSRRKGQSMFAMFSSQRAPRRPEELASALFSVTVETRPPQQAPQRGERTAATYTLRLEYPNGQKDDFVVSLGVPSAQFGPAPASPQAPPAPPPPQPPGR